MSAKSAASSMEVEVRMSMPSSLSSSCLRGIVVRHSDGTFHLADDRIKRTVGMLRRAEIAQARMRLAGEAVRKRRREPRFADASLAGKQHHLALTDLCSRPAPKQ